MSDQAEDANPVERQQNYWSENYQEMIRQMGWNKTPGAIMPKEGHLVQVMFQNGDTCKVRYRGGKWLTQNCTLEMVGTPVLWREMQDWELI